MAFLEKAANKFGYLVAISNDRLGQVFIIEMEDNNRALSFLTCVPSLAAERRLQCRAAQT